MKINRKTHIHTHEGAVAKKINIEQQLRRSLLACLLWEKTFYESGRSIADRIIELAEQLPHEQLAALAIEARTEYKLRHAPLLILLAMIKRGGKAVSDAIAKTIRRPDEITELVALYRRHGKKPLSAQMKLGLAQAFLKFDEYQLAKWDRPGDITLRYVMQLVHPKPKNEQQSALFNRLRCNRLKTPDTWESKEAAGKDKKALFTDLLTRKKLPYMALLRNLKKMNEHRVDDRLIRDAISRPVTSVLPYRFIAAAKHAPQYVRELDYAMMNILQTKEALPGRTALLVDVSGSMVFNKLSDKSELTRLDAACGLAILLSGICNQLRIFAFAQDLTEVPPYKGMALRDVIAKALPAGGTNLGGAVRYLKNNLVYDRLIVITDEQSHSPVPDPDPKCRAYMINVASYKNGVGYGPWLHIDGFSEAVVEYIQRYEKEID